MYIMTNKTVFLVWNSKQYLRTSDTVVPEATNKVNKWRQGQSSVTYIVRTSFKL